MLQRLLFFAVPFLLGFPVQGDRTETEGPGSRMGLFVEGDRPGNEEDRVEWNASRKLTWEDFTGAPDPSSPNAALTNSAINIEYGYDKNGLKHAIRCRFNKSKSWVKIKNDYILNHEQRHFDIAEVHARMLHREIKAYRFNSRTADADINAIYTRVIKVHMETQQQYDLQTHHSLDSAKQAEWDGKVDAMLESLADFADYRR